MIRQQNALLSYCRCCLFSFLFPFLIFMWLSCFVCCLCYFGAVSLLFGFFVSACLCVCLLVLLLLFCLLCAPEDPTRVTHARTADGLIQGPFSIGTQPPSLHPEIRLYFIVLKWTLALKHTLKVICE